MKIGTALAVAALLVAGAAHAGNDAPAPASEASVGARVEAAIVRGAQAAARGIEKGARAAEHGVKVGVKAAAQGIERGAQATARAARSVAGKIESASSAPPAPEAKP